MVPIGYFTIFAYYSLIIYRHLSRMLEKFAVKQKMIELKCCVIIPTYNNDGTLEDVLLRVLEYTSDVIIVNDGSTDTTPILLRKYQNIEESRVKTQGFYDPNGISNFLPDSPTASCGECVRGIQILTISRNTGKGNALQKAFRQAIDSGFRYAITIDSDGQHFPEDIPLFIEKIEKFPDSLILGARNMNQDGVPGSSNFGNSFSVFWFKVETGLTVPDVQTGFRLYPMNRVRELKRHFSVKFEYEVEILVRLAWMEVDVLSVPVRIYYFPKSERVSHFRKVRDFSRVSIVNTIMVFMALLWIRPLSFFRNLRKKSLKEFIREYIIDSKDSNGKLALSVSLGAFFGVMPIWGWQMLAAMGMASLLRLNKFIALAVSNISIPPLIPLIIFLSYITGGWVLGADSGALTYSSEFKIEWITNNILQYLIGSIVFGFALALALGSLSYLFLEIFRRPKKVKKN